MDTEIKSKRGGWGSNFGFLMASIGSAVGLGNIWGFPYKMGKSGGAVFLLLYLVLVVLVGVTVMLGELALGRRSGKSAVSTYRSLSKKYTWLGYAGIVCGFCIMCFYFVLGGIVLRYAVGYFLAIFGGSDFAWSGQGTGFFGYFLTDTNSMILFFVLYILLNILVVSGGVQGGIEKFCNVGMPALFCLLVFIILYIACQPGAAEGYKFMFSPDFSVFSNPDIGFGRVLKSAAGQMFFSLSIGLGVMMTYGSYLGKQTYSKYKIIDEKHIYLSSTKEQRGFLDTTIKVKNKKVHIINVHLGLNDKERKKQIKELEEYLRKLKNSYFIILGDFNEGNLSLNNDMMIDAAEQLNKSNILTFSIGLDRIDYMFVSNNIKVESYEVLIKNMSDHYPIVAKILI